MNLTPATDMRTTLDPADVQALTDRIEAAQKGATAIPKLTEDFPGMTLGDGNAVQLALLERWLKEGRRQIGWKAGLTSQAKMIQMGVGVPTVGFLLADMARPESSVITTEDLVHPRVECEVAFVLKTALGGRDCSRADVLAATDFVVPAIEVIDSRFSGFRFDLPSIDSLQAFLESDHRHAITAAPLAAGFIWHDAQNTATGIHFVTEPE